MLSHTTSLYVSKVSSPTAFKIMSGIVALVDASEETLSLVDFVFVFFGVSFSIKGLDSGGASP